MRVAASWEKFDEVLGRRWTRSQGSSCAMKSAWSSRRDVEGLILRALDSRAAASAWCNLCPVFTIHTKGRWETPRRKPPGYICRCVVLNKFNSCGREMCGETGVRDMYRPESHPPLRLTSYWYPLSHTGPQIPFSRLVETRCNPLCPSPPLRTKFWILQTGYSRIPSVRGISHMWRECDKRRKLKGPGDDAFALIPL